MHRWEKAIKDFIRKNEENYFQKEIDFSKKNRGIEENFEKSIAKIKIEDYFCKVGNEW